MFGKKKVENVKTFKDGQLVEETGKSNLTSDKGGLTIEPEMQKPAPQETKVQARKPFMTQYIMTLEDGVIVGMARIL